MPINDYRCKRCEMEFEYITVRSDDFPECPKCEAKGEDLEKQIPKDVSHEIRGASAKNNYGLKPGRG